jgi:hypothetical protein
MRLGLATRILIALLAVIVGYFYLVEEKHRKAAVAQHVAERKFLPFTADSVQKFVLVNPDGQRIEIARARAGWKITSPIAADADSSAIDSFLGQFVPGRRADEMPAVKDLASYGLEHPFASIVLYPRSGAPETLSVGDQTPTSSNSYIRLGSSKTVFISSSITHNLMNKSLYLLRDKSFVSFKSESVNAITIRAGRAKLDLARGGSYWWFAGSRARADRAKVEAYLTQLTGTIVRSFASESDSLDRFGLKNPGREITFAMGPELATVSFGTARDGEVYATRTGLDKVVALDGKLLGAFDWTRENMRAMNLAFFDPDSVKVIAYETPETSIVIRRAGEKWTAAGKDTISAAKSYVVDALLRKLSTAAFEKIVADPAAPGDRRLAPFALKVSLEDLLGGATDVITIARPSPAEVIGTSRSANVIGTLKKGALEDVMSIFKRIGEHAAPASP